MKSIERIHKYLDYKGIKPTRFEKDLGLSNGYLGSQLKRKSDMGESILNKIIDYCLDLNPEWLLTGEGLMLKYTDKNPVNQSIIGDNNIQTGSNSKLNAHRYNSDSPDMLRTLINEKDRLLVEKEERIKEKDAQIKEKDTQINMLLSILSNK